MGKSRLGSTLIRVAGEDLTEEVTEASEGMNTG